MTQLTTSQSLRILCICALVASYLWGVPAAGGAQRTSLNDSTLAYARFWVDGVPILPPYDIQVVGDSTVVVNGRVIVVVARTTPAPGKASRDPADVLRVNAYEAMREARRQELPDSVVASIGCAAFNADTTRFGRATVESPWQEIHLEGLLLPSGARSPGLAAVPPTDALLQKRAGTARDRAMTYYDLLKMVVQTGGVYLHNRVGMDQSIPPGWMPALLRDIRDAATEGPALTERRWNSASAGVTRVLSYDSAKAIATHNQWER